VDVSSGDATGADAAPWPGKKGSSTAAVKATSSFTTRSKLLAGIVNDEAATTGLLMLLTSCTKAILKFSLVL
jgi:hypothetical protein